ncbi:hypothetical protein K1T71_008170 [Dendrolimus kikuchii]|uniref:Uncharacterized protein n=1 Tax=Dendrolimus kikuchii TaxID=765133 RepID=A0ACC1CWA2_9NEOP|nr:hypothetical protein K1T71_008170 [Dendrolimus kikuchii]
MLIRLCLGRHMTRTARRLYCEGTTQTSGPSSTIKTPAACTPQVKEVPGLSSAVVQPASEPVGPGVDPNKSGAYKVPEYFCYDNMSFFEAEIEMSKFRLPQPSALK